VLVGHCYEEGSLSLPYLAFVEALRSYAQARDVSHLRKELGTGARSVARIVSEVRERLKIEPGPQVNPEEERYQLMQGVTEFLGSAAMSQPLLIVLEDLHSADKGTLEMLEHVGRNLADKRLLIVGTYRDVEVDRTHPLSAALAELRRLPGFARLLLRGLNPDEVRRLLSSIAGQEVPWSLAEAVHRQTEGNPLFVQEVVRYLVEEGVFTREHGQWRASSDTPVEMRIPDGLRDVIGKRLSRLSESCNRILSVAAVIGRDFQLEVLQRVAGVGDDELFAALEEARKMAVVEERTGVGARVSYRFAHAFFRSTLYEEIIAPKRIRLHRQVALALEEVYKNRLEEHAAELADHFSYSSDSADLEKSIRYGQMAAKRASAVYAYGEAVRLLEQALKVQEILDPEDKARRCDLLLELVRARLYGHDYQHILEVEAPMAFSLAEELGDSDRACEACRGAVLALIVSGTVFVSGTAEALKWVLAYDRHASPDTVHRAWADYGVAWTKWYPGDAMGAVSLWRESTRLARKLGDDGGFVYIGSTYVMFCPSIPEHVEEARRIADEIRGMWGRTESFVECVARFHVGCFLLQLGERQEAERVHREGVESPSFSRIPGWQYFSLAIRACYQIMDGQLEDAAQSREEIFRLGIEMGAPGMAAELAAWSGRRLSGYLGWGLEGLKRLEELARVGGFTDRGGPITRVYCLACAGQGEEAAAALDGFVDQYAADPEKIRHRWGTQILVLETAVVAGHARAAGFILNTLDYTPFKTTGLENPTCVARHLGGASALLGRHEEARKHYQEAIKVCTETRFRPELALTRLQLAELLLDHYPDEKKEAVEHLAFCIPEFRDMKMQPWLERALKHKEILKA
jgi:tetratricopeptide (TPR) repeat protein